MELKDRAKVDARWTWDLTPVYADEAAWEADLHAASEQVRALAAVPGTLGASAQSLAAGLDAVMAASQRAERVYAYAFLRKSGDNGDAHSQEMEARCIGLLTQLQAATAFLSPEILAIAPQTLDAYLADPLLKPYRHIVEGHLPRTQPHARRRARADAGAAERRRADALQRVRHVRKR